MTSRTPDRTLCTDLPAAEPGSAVRLQGWVHRRRELAQLTFLVVRDRTGLAQVVVRGEADVPPEETPVEVIGTATANDQAPGGIEVTEPTIRALSDDAETPPVELWRPTMNVGLPTLLDHAAVTWRHPLQRAKWELAAATMRGFRETLDAAGFTEVASPKLVESATESGANVFEVDYFGRPAYLAQSPQFYKQVLVGVFERVYEVGPVFRAEPHDTVRHLAEYVSLDVELGFIEDHREVIACLRDVVAGMVAAVHAYAGPAVERLAIDVPEVPDGDPAAPLPRGAGDRRRARRRARPRARSRARAGRLGEGRARQRLRRRRGLPDGATRPFYSHPDPEDPHWSRSFDLIFRGTELVSGAQRLHRYDDYVAHARGARLPLRALRVVRRGVPARHPAPRRLRDRARAVRRAAHGVCQHP